MNLRGRPDLKELNPGKRSAAFIIVFGSFWGLIESVLGSFLHMFNIPLTGLILGSAGMMIMLIARTWNNVTGSSLLIALVAATIKMASFTTVKLGPFAGIVMEGIIVECVVASAGLNPAGFIITGFIVGIYPVLQTIFTKTILFGMDFIPVVLSMAESLSRRTESQLGYIILVAYLVMHAVIGIGAAGFAWILKIRLERRIPVNMPVEHG